MFRICSPRLHKCSVYCDVCHFILKRNLGYTCLFIVTSVLWLFAAVVVGQALTPSTFLTTVDRARLKAVFEAALPVTDVVNAHYSILGLKLLGAPIPNAQVQSVLKHCYFLQRHRYKVFWTILFLSPNATIHSILKYIGFFLQLHRYKVYWNIYIYFSPNAQVQSSKLDSNLLARNFKIRIFI